MSLLANRWVQLMHIKKQIHHKNKELQKYKWLARKRLKALRQIRKQLAGAVNQLLVDYCNRRKLSSRAQARAQVARLLFIYQSSLIKWKKKNKLQQKKIRELRAQDDEVNESLRIVRNRLRMNPRRKWIIAKSLRRLRKPSNMRYLYGNADVEIDPELFKSLLTELNFVERYLKDRKQKKIRHDDDNLINISTFMTSEVLRKHVKKQKQQKNQNVVEDEQEKTLSSKKIRSKFGKELAYKTLQEIESSVNSIIGKKKTKVNAKQMMDMLIKANEQNLKIEQESEMDNGSEIHNLPPRLEVPKDASKFKKGKKKQQLKPRHTEEPKQVDVIDRRFLPKVIYKRPSYRKSNRVPIQEELPQLKPSVVENIKPIRTPSFSSTKKPAKRKSSHKERKLSGELENANPPNETESMIELNALAAHKFKDLYQGIEDLKLKRNDDSSSTRSYQSQRESKSLMSYINKRKRDSRLSGNEPQEKRKSHQSNEDQKVGELQLKQQKTYLQQVQHIKALKNLKHLSSHQQRQLRQLQQQVKKQMSQQKYIQHLQQLRKLQQKMRDGKPGGDQSDEELNELLGAGPSELPPETTSQPGDSVAVNKFEDQLEKGKTALKIIFEGLSEEGQPKDVAALLRNKSVSDIHRSDSYHDDLTREVSFHVSSKRATVGYELLAKMALDNNSKIMEVQNVLRDTISAPSLLDALVDRQAIINTVRNHDLWNTLYDLYANLKNVQIPPPAIYQMMRSQYLKYIGEIANEAIQNGAKIIKRKLTASKSDMRQRGYSDSQEDLMSYLQAPNERKSAMSYSSMEYDRVSGDSTMYRDLRRMDDRYSVLVIQSILSAHSKYFEHLAAMEQASDAIQKVQQQMQEPKKAKPVQPAPAKQEKKRPASCLTRLFYEPRRTCRQRQADEERTPCECPSEAKLDVCIKCGAELTTLPESEPSSSRADLGLPDDVLTACMHNPEVLRATANICERCSFVHKPNALCPSFKAAGDGATRLQQQLHLIKHHASSNRQHLEGCSCCCCCQPAASAQLNA